MVDLLVMLAAIPVAALGGAAFLDAVLGAAQRLRLPRMLVATTLAAFATSSPEFAVSSLAALAGRPEIGLGDALGSNVVNLGLILGLALLYGAMAAHFEAFRRDFALALAVPGLTLLLALDGSLSRADGTLLLVLFAVWMILVTRQALGHRRGGVAESDPAPSPVRIWLLLAAGLGGLLLAGRLFVSGASGLAATLGVSSYLIGVTVVALGTSLPELVTMLLSRLRGHDDVGLGTLLGSNLFNGLAIVGTAAAITPIRAPLAGVAAALAFGALTVVMVVPRAGRLSRRRGVSLLTAYAAFVVVSAAPAA